MRLDLNEGSVLISHYALDLLSTTHGCVWVGVVSIYRFPGSIEPSVIRIELMILSGGNRVYRNMYGNMYRRVRVGVG